MIENTVSLINKSTTNNFFITSSITMSPGFLLFPMEHGMTVVEGNPKAPFLIATTLRCREGCYSFSWIALLYPWSIPYNAEC